MSIDIIVWNVGESKGDIADIGTLGLGMDRLIPYYGEDPITKFPLEGEGGFYRRVEGAATGKMYCSEVLFYGSANKYHAGHNVYFEITNAKCDDIPLYFE